MRKVLLVAVILSLGLAVAAYGQGLEETIKSRIASEANLDSDLIGVILYDQGGARLMLTFIYINERTLDSDLNPDIKDAIRPYQDEKAMLVMATVQGEASFDPYQIYVGQGGFKNKLEPAQVIKVTSDFEPGNLQQVTSKGIVLLPAGIDSTKELVISYKDSGHSVEMVLRSAAPEERVQQPQPRELGTQVRPAQPQNQSNYFWGQNNYFWEMIKYAVANLLMVLLLPVLVL